MKLGNVDRTWLEAPLQKCLRRQVVENLISSAAKNFYFAHVTRPPVDREAENAAASDSSVIQLRWIIGVRHGKGDALHVGGYFILPSAAR